jgi:N-acetylglucosaminyl-diphospho-decaprenol L-rhamnosyltransferase
MKLLVVIVNYRTADLTIDCLRSLRDQIEGHRVVVVDGDSRDGSAKTIAADIERNNWSTWASLIPLGHNGGFAFANNTAIRPALSAPEAPQYVLLLNPDTIVRPGAIASLLEFMDAHPKVGIAGSRLEEPDGTPQQSAFRFPGVLSELESGTRIALVSSFLRKQLVPMPVPREACQVDWVAGASMMIRRETFDAIGLLDEQYFMYFEEVDFCLRAKKAGWACWYVPRSRVMHLVGRSSGVTDVSQSRKRRPGYWFASRRRFFLTHHGRVRTALADILWATGFTLWRVRRAILRQPDNDPEHLLADFVRHNFRGKSC